MKFVDWVVLMLLIAFVVLSCYFGFVPEGRETWKSFKANQMHDFVVYGQRKDVEDTCRAMIMSWHYELLTYRLYKDAESKEMQDWAELAKTQANRIADNYNKYMLENSYVWGETIPIDIYAMIDTIE